MDLETIALMAMGIPSLIFQSCFSGKLCMIVKRNKRQAQKL